jgi:hypothetical protein
MKYIITIKLILLISLSSIAQDAIVDKIMLGELLEEENKLAQYQTYDFSKLWTQTSNRSVFGIIGKNHKRLKVKLISINQTDNNLIYKVYGKSCVDGNICEFNGTIEIEKILKLNELHLGVDDEFKEAGIKDQGLIIANYKFEENVEQIHSGTFKGQLYSKWYIDNSNQIKYDNIQLQSDSYFNNASVGEWISYKTNQTKLCNWGDYRIPECNSDFDIGAGEFSPSERYYTQGWENYQNAWLSNNKVAQEIELNEWWR